MKTDYQWKLKMPFKFNIDFKSNRIIHLDDVKIRFVLNENSSCSKIIQVNYTADNRGGHDFHEEYNQVVKHVGIVMQAFVEFLAPHLEGVIYNIFNGEDFIIPFEVETFNWQATYPNPEFFTLKLENIEQAIQDTKRFLNKEMELEDILQHRYRQALHYFRVGNFEMSVLNMAMTSEYFLARIIKEFSLSRREVEKKYKKEIKNNMEVSLIFIIILLLKK
ncbi:hypothetical protein C5G87_18965 [Paenibacillus peoriae]|uniref:hypothetical protein n=1 Tax=Paenibacillus peoriae TaxID=59893 RepID=UPI000CEBD8F0|nr:hypothetical protein [Paenibacillus peoriae]PPQ47391.1 hypothetical protein C5G87_18965 [Paenibacillus peoriae]